MINRQSGFISLNIIILIILGLSLVGGLYLVSHRTNLPTKAANQGSSGISLQSKYLSDGVSTSSLVNVEVYSDTKPDKYRLANASSSQKDSPSWVEYSYPDWASTDQPVSSVWHLDPVPGDKKVLLQFHHDNDWDTQVYEAEVKLAETSNPFSLTAQCQLQKDPTQAKVVARWDTEEVKKLQTEFLWLQLYGSNGALIADYPNPDLTKSDYTFEVPTPTGNYTLVGIAYLPNDSNEPLSLVKPLGLSEFTTSCDTATLPTDISLTYNDQGYNLTWAGLPGYSEAPSYGLKGGFQVYLSTDYQNTQPICGSCQVLFQNVGTDRKFHFDNDLTGFSPRPGVTQKFSKLTKGQKYALVMTSGAYRIGDKVIFTAK